jgi:hypothetical protein
VDNFVSAAAFGLVKMVGEQILLISEIKKGKAISEAIDSVNNEFGASAIFPASMFLVRDSAPDRIPFSSPRYDIIF